PAWGLELLRTWTDEDLAGRILGGGDGPANFNTGATLRRHAVFSCDVNFGHAPAEIEQRVNDWAPLPERGGSSTPPRRPAGVEGGPNHAAGCLPKSTGFILDSPTSPEIPSNCSSTHPALTGMPLDGPPGRAGACVGHSRRAADKDDRSHGVRAMAASALLL